MLAPAVLSLTICLIDPVDHVTSLQNDAVVDRALYAAEERAEARASRQAERAEARERRDWAQERADRSAPPVAESQQTSPPAPAGSPRDIARALVPASQWGCFDSIISHESSWNPRAVNPSSGAYGLPQALPGSKMASAGADWRTNPATQVRWALSYMSGRYGSPCGAWAFWQRNHWY